MCFNHHKTRHNLFWASLIKTNAWFFFKYFSSISYWNIDKIFQVKTTGFILLNWDTNQVYFFLCTPNLFPFSYWISVLSFDLRLQFISQISVIYGNSKKLMLLRSVFLLFFGSLICLIQLIFDAYTWAVEIRRTRVGGTPSVDQKFESLHSYLFKFII